MAIEDQTRFPKTPATGAEAGNKSIVDSNLQVEDVLYIPVGETDTLNGGKDRAGAIRITDGKFKVYMGNGVWAEYLVESDGLKEVGDLVLAGNSLTVTAPIKWRINSVNYEKLTDSVFTITNATTGYNRIDLVYAKTDNTLDIIEGVETMGVAVEPTLPVDTIRVAPVYITGSDIAPPLPDLTNYYTKSQVDALFVLNTLTFEDGVQKVGTTVSADDSVVRLNPSVAQSGSVNVTGSSNFSNSLNRISGAIFDASSNALDLRLAYDNSNIWTGVRTDALARTVSIGTFPFNFNSIINSDGNLIVQKQPTIQPSPTQILTRDEVTGEVKQVSPSDLSTAIGSGFVAKSGDTMTGDLILSSPTPPNALSASPKVYVDNAIAGLKFKLDVLVASTANVNVASAPSSLDGVTLTNGDRVLLKNQTNASQNGIYIFNGTGNALTRSLDADTGVELANKTIPVNSGTVNADKWFTITNDSITLGTTNIVITQTAGAGTYSAGSNIAIAGNVVGVVNNPTFSGTVTAPTFAGNATKWGNLTNSGANNNDANTTILTFNNATNNAGYTTNSQIKGLLGINDGSSLNNVVSLSIASGGVNVNSGNNVSIGKDLASSGPLYFNYGGLPGGVTISDYVFQDGQGATKANIRAKTTITDGFTVATLPTGVIGMRAYVTDALTPTYLGVVVGGGAVTCPVFFNGTNWIT